MILTDKDIKTQMSSGNINIIPFNKERLGSNSYDVTLGNTLLIYTSKILDCKVDNPYKTLLIPEEGYLMRPGELYLGYVNEYITSKGLVPTIEGKSSVARLGLSVHLTAGLGDINWCGHFTLEMTVVKPLKVYADMPLAQIVWTLPLGKCEVPYSLKKNAKYNNQPGKPIPSMMHLNF